MFSCVLISDDAWSMVVHDGIMTFKVIEYYPHMLLDEIIVHILILIY